MGVNPVSDTQHGQQVVNIPPTDDLFIRACSIRGWTRRRRAKQFGAVVDDLVSRFEQAVANHENLWQYVHDRPKGSPETFSVRCKINCPQKDSGLFNCIVAIGRAGRTEVSYTRGRKSQSDAWMDSSYRAAFNQLVSTMYALASQGIYPTPQPDLPTAVGTPPT